MTITFADGTGIEIAATALDDFIKHDLKWVEFVHGRATVKKPSCTQISAVQALPQGADRCSSPQCCRAA